ncbi:hypothetical protein Bca101_003326 [Brassica carinata]
MEIDALFIRAEGELNDAYLFSNQKAQNEGTEKIFILGTTKFDLYAYSELGCVHDKAENRPSTDVTMLKIRTAEIPRPQEYNYYNNVKFLSEEAAAADDLPLQYSPMSEDSDEARFCDDRTSTSSSQPESRPTCPVLPYRYQRPLTFQVQGKAMLTVKRECALSLWKKIIERKISLTLSS